MAKVDGAKPITLSTKYIYTINRFIETKCVLVAIESVSNTPKHSFFGCRVQKL
jgi:hypothetical protein